MSMSKRLLILVGAALLGMVALLGISTYQMRAVYREADYSNENVIPSMLVLDRAMLDFSQIRVRSYRHALNSDQSAMQDLEAKIEEARQGVGQSLKDYEPLVSGEKDKALLEKDKRAYADYMSGLTGVLEASRQGDKEKARELLTQYAHVAEAFNSALIAHMEYNREQGLAAKQSAAARMQWALEISIGLAVLMVLAMAALGYAMYRHLSASLARANQVVARIAAGDLREVADTHNGMGKDEIGRLLAAMEKMRMELSGTIRSVVDNAQEIAASAERLSTTADQVATSTERQSSAAASGAASVEELTVSIDHIGTGADDANHRAVQAGDLAEKGGQSVDVASRQISNVAERIQHTAEQLGQLSDKVQQIGGISAVIREVADQTNLLALNAAIEAARAGEQGRGFAVVADEVRKLAERTTNSVQEISAVILTIEQGASAAVESMRVSQTVVSSVVGSAKQAEESMKEICDAADTVRDSVNDISAALKEQRAASTELAKNIEAMAQMSEENAAAVASVSSTAHQLASVSQTLKTDVSRFVM